MAKAVALEETASGRVGLAAMKFFYDWDWNGVESDVKRALKLDVSQALPHDIYAKLLMALGRFDEGLMQAQEAVK
ncbi:MAG: hypothetical protein EXS36_16370 [Pedosphaera sp.]|nr:hypothetical protein [Pedosphaera sp.]